MISCSNLLLPLIYGAEKVGKRSLKLSNGELFGDSYSMKANYSVLIDCENIVRSESVRMPAEEKVMDTDGRMRRKAVFADNDSDEDSNDSDGSSSDDEVRKRKISTRIHT